MRMSGILSITRHLSHPDRVSGAKADSRQAPSNLLSLPFTIGGSKEHCSHSELSTWVQGIQTDILKWGKCSYTLSHHQPPFPISFFN